jgi:hypothetical protein
LKTFHAGLLLKVSSLILHLWSLAPSSTNFDDRTRPLTRSSALRDCSSWCRCYKTSLYSVAGGARSKLECLFLYCTWHFQIWFTADLLVATKLIVGKAWKMSGVTSMDEVLS